MSPLRFCGPFAPAFLTRQPTIRMIQSRRSGNKTCLSRTLRASATLGEALISRPSWCWLALSVDPVIFLNPDVILRWVSMANGFIPKMTFAPR